MMSFLKTRYLIRKRALGDVLLIEPLIRQLAIKHKKVVVFTKFNILFKDYPFNNVEFVDDLSIFHKVNYRVHDFFKWKFLYINLNESYEIDPQKHILHAYQDKAGLPNTIETPKLYFGGSQIEGINKDSKYVIIHLETMSMRNYRNVYGVDWGQVVSFLNNLGFKVLQIGIKPELIEGAVYQKTTIEEMIYLINNCNLFIGIDSGPSHIAAAQGKKSILFFGAINPWFRHFKNLFNGIIMQSYCEFQNCYHTVIQKNGPSCRLVGDEGIPKCSVHYTADLLNNISKILISDKTNL